MSSRGRGRGKRGGGYGSHKPRGSRGGHRGRGSHSRGRGRGGYRSQSSSYYGDYYGGYYDGYYYGYYGEYYDYYSSGHKSKGPYEKKNQFNFAKDKKEEEKVVKSFVHDEKTVKKSLETVAKEGKLSVMMVTEKPSIAKTIASILSFGRAKESQGFVRSLPVWEYDGEFKGFKANFKVTSVAGHMYARDFPEKVDTWKVDPKDLFKEETVQKPTSKGTCKHIQTIGKDINVLLLWLDCDREGENICFEVIDNLKSSLPFPRENYIFRAKFSSLADKDIIHAYENIMNKPNENEASSVDARQIIDLKIGVAFSVFQTLKLTEKYPMIQNITKTVSYGPCQFPTLGF
jgi:reverse gyrase